ncbi:MAG: type II secretion system protein GspL [Gammaproteobacteria bacterium RIFCSPHIGHO2_12_FULL_37_14]|nr:MAG: type II secretion system protein GspL [Gammaproteobacteria bacterium RIFCSPHIGHO2_12_FULL_37_14]
MQEKLIIYINENNDQRVSWAVITADGIVRQSAMYDVPQGLVGVAQDKHILVIVPAEDVLLLTGQLPKMNRSRLLQSLPYALEEQLIDDVETLHFAIADYQPNGDLPVAIVGHHKMRQWLAVLQDWGIQADVLLPASFAIPVATGKWSISVNTTAIIRTSMYQGFSCDKSSLHEFFKLALAAAAEKPEQITIRNYTNDRLSCVLADIHHSTLSEASHSHNKQFLSEEVRQPEQLINDLALEVANTIPINLLQGPYAVKKSTLLQANKIWQAMTYLALTFSTILILYPAVSYILLKEKLITIDNQITAIYKRQFPQASTVVAPKQRIEEKLTRLQRQGAGSRFLSLAGSVGKAMQDSSGIALKRMDFQNSQLTVELTATTSESFAKLNDRLIAQGLHVKQQNTNLVNSHISVTLVIE